MSHSAFNPFHYADGHLFRVQVRQPDLIVLIGGGVAGQHPIVPIAPAEHENIVADSAFQVVVARPAVKDVISALSVEPVVALAPIQDITIVVAVKLIVACPAVQSAALARGQIQPVVPGCAVEAQIFDGLPAKSPAVSELHRLNAVSTVQQPVENRQGLSAFLYPDDKVIGRDAGAAVLRPA